MKLNTLTALTVYLSIVCLSGCMNAYEEKGLCSYMGACKEKEDCVSKGTCGSTQLLPEPEPLLPTEQLLP